MLPPFPSETALRALSVFPYPEGKQFEFKGALIQAQKLVQTICAFLNSDGGYIVFGIHDRTLHIEGIECSMKDLDTFILTHIDELFHSRTIVRQDTFEPLYPRNISVQTMLLCNGRHLLIIRVQPDFGAQYQLSNGETYFRANVSNMRIIRERVYKEGELMHMMHIQKCKMQKEYESLVYSLSSELRQHSVQIEEMRYLLWRKILEEKGAVEAERTDWDKKGNRGIKWLFGIVFSCFP